MATAALRRLADEAASVIVDACWPGQRQATETRDAATSTVLTALVRMADAHDALLAQATAALAELLAAADNCVTSDDDVAAMLRYGKAVEDAEALLAQMGVTDHA